MIKKRGSPISKHEKKPLVLIVEDEKDIQRIIVQTLADDYETMIARDISEAYSIIATSTPEIILADIMLPGGSGIELLKHVHAKGIKSPFIFVSGQSGKRELLTALKLGAFDFIEKPFGIDQLTAVVNRAAEYLKIKAELLHAQRRCYEAEKLASVALVTTKVIHEVSTPLTIMQALSSAILKDISKVSSLEPIKEKSQKLHEALHHVIKIILNRKSLIRVGKPQEIEAISIAALVEQSVNLCKDYFEIERIQMINDVHSHDLVEVNLTELNQVFINLLMNAVQALRGRDSKWIKAELTQQDGNYVTISIIDNGCGVSSLHRKKIFSPFFSTKETSQESGLGLSTALEIIKSYNGDLFLETNHKHTCFSIKFPMRHRNARKKSVEL